jgi:RNA polymerase sigma-70 factor (ECF subfamily)
MAAVMVPRSAREALTVMTAANDSFHEFLTRLQARDGEAARELFRRFTGQLITLARRRLEGPLRHKVDSEDVVQSTYKSFFRLYDEGDLDFANWNSLWGLLTLITLRKCADRVAYHRAKRRDAARELKAAPGSEGGGPLADALGREPTPDEAAALTETVERLLASLDADERLIVELSLQGHSTREVSEQLDVPERTVRRVRERVRRRLERAQGEAS